jgi:hypothetical protein
MDDVQAVKVVTALAKCREGRLSNEDLRTCVANPKAPTSTPMPIGA